MRGAALRVVEQLGDQAGELALVVRRRVERRVAGRDARLEQVEGDDRAPHRHVLDDLVHRRDVVERVLGIGREADVGGREVARDVLVGDAAR